MHLISGVAFCTVCAKLDAWLTMKDAQFLLSIHGLEHTHRASGITWYTPNLPGPPTACQLSHELNVNAVYRLFPMTPDGYVLPRPEAVSVSAIAESLDRYHTEPADPHRN